MTHRLKRRPIAVSISLALMTGLTACGSSNDGDTSQSLTQNPPSAPATPATPVTPTAASATFISPASGAQTACAGMKGGQAMEGFPANTTIVMTRVVAATATIPEHCEIKGTIDAGRVGADGQTYAIKWHMRLPTQWNGRFYFEGGGGLNGNLGDALGNNAGVTGALAQRYAVVSQDSGHANTADPDFGTLDSVNTSPANGTNQFAFDPQARIDHGYRSYDVVTQASKATLRKYYSQAPFYSYFNGCSEGGREGLLMSQRFPDSFDGIVAGNPGMDLPKASIAEAWDSQQFAAAAREAGQFTDSGDPWLGKAFSPSQMTAISNAILGACDATDGVTDGMVLNPEACSFDPGTLGPDGSKVLTAQQVASLKNIFAGPKNSKGEELYAGWFWDPGIAGGGWRQWKMGSDQPSPTGAKANSSLNLSPFAGGGAIAYVFSTPPNRPTRSGITVTAPAMSPDALTKYVLSFDMDVDAPSFFATSGNFAESAYDRMFTSSTNYDRFKARNGKLLVYTGAADPVFSAKYHINWYRQLMTKYGSPASAQAFARLFVVPGMNHCGGGVATDNFDAFGSLVNWVEKGAAPDSIVASTRPANTDLALLSTAVPATRTRPLCPYPKFAKWAGKAGDDINDGKNFVCE